jgi:hypothetical protein
LQQILTRALQRTAGLWPPLKDAYSLVYQAAHILATHQRQTGAQVRETYLAWVQQMQEQKTRLGPLGAALDHFAEKTANFAPGLFHCYDVPDLPCTNNDLEHCFGVARAHERRATGRRGAIPGVVVRGSVRLIAVLVSKGEDLQAADLQPSDYRRWRELRAQLQYRQETRRQQFRFRKDPAVYLARLEAQLLE